MKRIFAATLMVMVMGVNMAMAENAPVEVGYKVSNGFFPMHSDSYCGYIKRGYVEVTECYYIKHLSFWCPSCSYEKPIIPDNKLRYVIRATFHGIVKDYERENEDVFLEKSGIRLVTGFGKHSGEKSDFKQILFPLDYFAEANIKDRLMPYFQRFIHEIEGQLKGGVK